MSSRKEYFLRLLADVPNVSIDIDMDSTSMEELGELVARVTRRRMAIARVVEEAHKTPRGMLPMRFIREADILLGNCEKQVRLATELLVSYQEHHQGG